jgi:hypothetical protein
MTSTSNCTLKSSFVTVITNIAIVITCWCWRFESFREIGIVSNLITVNEAVINSPFLNYRLKRPIETISMLLLISGFIFLLKKRLIRCKSIFDLSLMHSHDPSAAFPPTDILTLQKVEHIILIACRTDTQSSCLQFTQ